ncbi:site-specific integrase [Nonomuraea sp. NPDC026600]|uniref:site-specific integrase n=1 Tax=Nonomuraea sp. NPDC026600 TaxID=3155363 RepID=UPI0033E462B4
MSDDERALPAPAAGERPPIYPLPENSGTHTAADYTLSEQTRSRIADGVPANTRRAYARQWAAFTSWCAEHGRVALPATGHTLAEYTSQLCEAGQAPASVEQAIAAVRTMHRLAGHTGQPVTEAARLALRTYKAPHSPGKGGALLRRPPLRTVRATRRCTRLKQAPWGGSEGGLWADAPDVIV